MLDEIDYNSNAYNEVMNLVTLISPWLYTNKHTRLSHIVQ